MATRTVKLLAAIWLLLPALATAQERGDSEQPVYIEADEFTADRKKGVSVYRGHVSFKQGGIELRADSVEVSGDRDLEKIVAKGKPVRYSQKLKNGSPDTAQSIRGEAESIEYFVAKGVVIFKGKAHLWRGLDEFIADYIKYDIQSERVDAKRVEGGRERVKVVIQPEKQDKQSK